MSATVVMVNRFSIQAFGCYTEISKTNERFTLAALVL
jgi:hypothetical protein